MINWAPGMTLEAVERECIKRAMSWFRGNKTQTAMALGIAIRTLDNKLEKYAEEDEKQANADADFNRRRTELLDRQRGFKKEEDSLHSTSTGNGVEPAAKDTGKQDLPLHERKEVQKVLPRRAAKGRASAAR